MTRLASALLLLASCAAPPAGPHQAGVLFFITTDCPIANSFAPEIARIVDDYRARGVTFQMVYTDGTQSMETVRRHASDYGYKSPVRIDTGRVLPGQYRLKSTTRELRDAIEAVLDGRPVPVAETKAAGCPLTD